MLNTKVGQIFLLEISPSFWVQWVHNRDSLWIPRRRDVPYLYHHLIAAPFSRSPMFSNSSLNSASTVLLMYQRRCHPVDMPWLTVEFRRARNMSASGSDVVKIKVECNQCSRSALSVCAFHEDVPRLSGWRGIPKSIGSLLMDIVNSNDQLDMRQIYGFDTVKCRQEIHQDKKIESTK